MVRKSAFISATSLDLNKEGDSYIAEIQRILQKIGIITEYILDATISTNQNPIERCLAKIEENEIFIGIYAHRYGYIPNDPKYNGKSITELEFDRAKALNKKILCFFIKENYPWCPNDIELENDLSKLHKLRNFKKTIEKNFIRGTFTTKSDLAKQVLLAVCNIVINEEKQLFVDMDKALAYLPEYFILDQDPLHSYRLLNKWREISSTDASLELIEKLIKKFENLVLQDPKHQNDPKFHGLRLRLQRYLFKKASYAERYKKEIQNTVDKLLINQNEFNIEVTNEILRGIRDYTLISDEVKINRLLNILIAQYDKLRRNLNSNDLYSNALIGSVAYTLGRVYFLIGQLDKAENCYKTSIEDRSIQEDYQGMAYQKRELAKIEFLKEQKDLDKINNLLKEAMDYAIKGNDSRIILTLYAWSLIILPKNFNFNGLNYDTRISEINNMLTRRENYPFPDVSETKSILHFCLRDTKEFPENEKATVSYRLFEYASSSDENLEIKTTEEVNNLIKWIKVRDVLRKKLKIG